MLCFSRCVLPLLRPESGLGSETTGGAMYWEVTELTLAEARCRGFDVAPATFCVPAIGRDKPRNFPRLATPTPHVSCVL